MYWPSSLVYVSMYYTLHDNLTVTDSRNTFRFFFVVFAIIFVWELVPSYMFFWIGSISILCLISPYSKIMNILGSAHRGMGLGFLTFDWNAVAFLGPLYTPW